MRVAVVYHFEKPGDHQPDSKCKWFNTVAALRVHGISTPASILSAHLPSPVDRTWGKEGTWVLAYSL